MRHLTLVLLTVFTLLLGSAWIGVHPSTLYHPSAIIIVFGSLFVYLSVAVGPKKLLEISQRINQKTLLPEDASTLERIGVLGYLFGSISVVVGFIHVFQNLSEPTLIGKGVAVALTGLVYGALPAILINLVTGVQTKPMSKSRTYLGTTTAVVMVFLGIVIFVLSQTPGA